MKSGQSRAIVVDFWKNKLTKKKLVMKNEYAVDVTAIMEVYSGKRWFYDEIMKWSGVRLDGSGLRVVITLENMSLRDSFESVFFELVFS